MNKKELRDVKGGSELYGAMLELDSTKTLLEDHIHDLKLELTSAKQALRSTVKRFKKGEELYKKTYGKDINLKKST